MYVHYAPSGTGKSNLFISILTPGVTHKIRTVFDTDWLYGVWHREFKAIPPSDRKWTMMRDIFIELYDMGLFTQYEHIITADYHVYMYLVSHGWLGRSYDKITRNEVNSRIIFNLTRD